MLVVGGTIRQWRQRHSRQRLALRDTVLQARGRDGVAGGGYGEDAGLNEKPGLLNVCQGLLEKGDGSVVVGMALSKAGHGRQSIVHSFW